MLGAWALRAAGPLLWAVQATANCAVGPFVEAYSPERCWIKGGAVSMKCDEKWNSASCGMRLNALGTKVGTGQWSMSVKAAPGSGAVTTFYLSNNGGMYDLSKPWNEVDFEIFGNTAKPGGSKVWTNLFTGHMVENNAVIDVPFDVSADYHTYTFELSETTVKWLVDGIEYRSQDITGFPDAQNSIRSWAFRPFISFWGKTSKDPALGVPEFRKLMGKLDWNGNPFPLVASFKAEWNPPVPEVHVEPCGSMEESIDYVVKHQWYRTLTGVGDKDKCCALCQQEKRCLAWTVVLPDVNFTGQCWLKGGLPSDKKPKDGVVSGFPRPANGGGAGPAEGGVEASAEGKFLLLPSTDAAALAPVRRKAVHGFVAVAPGLALTAALTAAAALVVRARRGPVALLGMQAEEVPLSEVLADGLESVAG